MCVIALRIGGTALGKTESGEHSDSTNVSVSPFLSAGATW